MQAHEYSIIGHNRANVGRFLGAIAALAASLATSVLAGLGKFLTSHGVPSLAYTIPTIAISGGLAYGIVYWGFNKFGWKLLSRFSKIPNIDGEWECKGKTMADSGEVEHDWSAKMTISQNWEKIQIKQRTDQSSSNSVSAALIPCADGTFLLMYSYRNEPRTGEAELRNHIGYCELQFEKDLKNADGDYFTAKGRHSIGRISITRKEN